MPLKPNNVTCLNCGAALQGNFCVQCGQKADVGRITFTETFKNFLSYSFSLEGPLSNTIIHLIKNPGKVFREFIGGKRKAYYQPVQFYVLLTAIYLIVRALLNYDPLEGQMDFDVNQSAAMSKTKEAARFMVDNINNIMFFLVFSIAFILKLFFRRRYNLAEYTSIGLFIAGIYILFGIVIMMVGSIVSSGNNGFQLLVMLFLIGYSTASLFQQFNFLSFIKYTLVSLFSMLLYMIMGFGFAFLMVSLR